MAETAALTPTPFYPPVRIDAGAYHGFKDVPDRPGRREPRNWTHAALPPGADGMAYARDGRCIDDPLIGTHVNIYV